MKDFFFINISKFAALLNEDKFDLIATSKKKAENTAKNRFPNCDLHNDIGDAYRHAYFSALNAQNSSLGYVKAKQLGDAHECETPVSEQDEKTMDLHNNAWGYSFAGSNQYFTEAMFYSAFMTAFENGEIKILENCN